MTTRLMFVLLMIISLNGVAKDQQQNTKRHNNTLHLSAAFKDAGGEAFDQLESFAALACTQNDKDFDESIAKIKPFLSKARRKITSTNDKNAMAELDSYFYAIQIYRGATIAGSLIANREEADQLKGCKTPKDQRRTTMKAMGIPDEEED